MPFLGGVPLLGVTRGNLCYSDKLLEIRIYHNFSCEIHVILGVPSGGISGAVVGDGSELPEVAADYLRALQTNVVRALSDRQDRGGDLV